MTALATRPQYADVIVRATPDGKGGVATDAFNKFLDDLMDQGAILAGSVEALGGRINNLSAALLNKPVVAVTGVAYECAGHEDVIVATAGVEIKLPAAPGRNKNIKVVKATAANLPVHGNGKNIVGDTDIEIRTPIYSALNLTYVLDRDEWFIT